MNRFFALLFIFIIYFKVQAQEIKPDSTLPVQLIYFYADSYVDSIVIQWGTATETENYGYNLERSISAINNFEFLAFISGNGNSNSPKFYSYTDTLIDSNKVYYYRLKQIDTNGSFKYSDTIAVNYLTSVEDEQTQNYNFKLFQNYPNPFNPETNISFQILESSKVKLLVYNSLGQLIKILLDDDLETGYHRFKFSAKNLSSGVYFYQLIVGENTLTRTMILIK
ncbi:MAG TPA: T9SS type A sorting domain-containing protein [Ignavibacteriaceae bacterium]|nr:T9SS type A sorting domain-containing protein [Ignavibacteriaceae bacterium]